MEYYNKIEIMLVWLEIKNNKNQDIKWVKDNH